MSNLREWKDENSQLKVILAGSGLFSLLVFVMALMPYLAGTYLGAIPLIMALAIDAGLFVGTFAFSVYIGLFN